MAIGGQTLWPPFARGRGQTLGIVAGEKRGQTPGCHFERSEVEKSQVYTIGTISKDERITMNNEVKELIDKIFDEGSRGASQPDRKSVV